VPQLRLRRAATAAAADRNSLSIGPRPVSLPEGLSWRTLTEEDVDAVVAMVNECELHDTGETMWERADVLSDSSIEGFDRGRDWVGVFEGDRVVGWAMLVHHRSVWADVDPDARGQGIGTWLRAWSESRGREIGTDRIGQTIDDRLTDVADFLTCAGYTPRHTSWILLMEHAELPASPSPPEGIELRPIRAADAENTFGLFERAFSEFGDRLPSTASTWRAMTFGREGFHPQDLIVAVDGDRVVGGAFFVDSNEIWVDKLAVDREYRRRGIARALLLTAFRRSFERGYRQTRLSTDSRTGALTLYERLGMRVQRSFTNYGLDLARPA
jgi:mycothiol synthase